MSRTKSQMLKEALETLNATEEYNARAQDMGEERRDEKHEAIIEAIGGQGFVGQSPDADNSKFDNLVEYLQERIVWVPGHWEAKKK